MKNSWEEHRRVAVHTGTEDAAVAADIVVDYMPVLAVVGPAAARTVVVCTVALPVVVHTLAPAAAPPVAARTAVVHTLVQAAALPVAACTAVVHTLVPAAAPPVAACTAVPQSPQQPVGEGLVQQRHSSDRTSLRHRF